MGVYTSVNNAQFNDDNIGVIECAYEPGIEAAMNIVVESETNYNAIMQAIGVHELAVFESTGVEMVYEATDIASLMKKVKDFFMNILEKIKGLFKKFFALIDSFIKSDADFVKKYSPKIVATETKGLKVKGFKFDHLDGFSLPTQDAMLKLYDEEKDGSNSEEIHDKMRGLALGNDKRVESGEFVKELFKHFRSGEDSKVDIENIVPRDELKIISGTKELKTQAEKNYKALVDSINKAIAQLKKDSKEATNAAIDKTATDDAATDASAKVRKFNAHIAYAKESISVLQLLNGAYLTALKDRNRQSKFICVKLVEYKAPKNESFSFQDSVDGSFLDSVKLR